MSRAFFVAALLLLCCAAQSVRAQESGGLTIEEWEEPSSSDSDATEDGIPECNPDDSGEAPSPPTAASLFQITARPYGFLRTRGGVDTAFQSARGERLAEDVIDLRSRWVVGLDAKLAERLRLVVEARAFYRASAQRGFDRARANFEPEVGEAFVDFYSQAFDLRVGYQTVSFGANAAFAPADSLNPRDLREGFLLVEPEDVKLPNAAVRARGRVGRVDLTAVYFPFFRASRYAVFGQDEAMVQPALGVAVPVELHPSIEEGLQPHVLETERPQAYPWLGEWGLRATTKVGSATVGASWAWTYEKIPAVTLDPELSALVRASARGVEPDPATAVSVQERTLAGEKLLRGHYPRQHLLSLEAQVLLGTAQLDLDASYSPAQTLYDARLNPLRLRTFTWVAGVSQAADSPFLYSVNYLGFAVPDLPSEGYLFLLEPATAAGAPRTVWFHALFVQLGYALFDRRLELTFRGGVEPIQRSWAIAPRAAWREGRHTVGVGLELYEGRTYSPFGYFSRNDQVVASWTVELF